MMPIITASLAHPVRSDGLGQSCQELSHAFLSLAQSMERMTALAAEIANGFRSFKGRS